MWQTNLKMTCCNCHHRALAPVPNKWLPAWKLEEFFVSQYLAKPLHFALMLSWPSLACQLRPEEISQQNADWELIICSGMERTLKGQHAKSWHPTSSYNLIAAVTVTCQTLGPLGRHLSPEALACPWPPSPHMLHHAACNWRCWLSLERWMHAKVTWII